MTNHTSDIDPKEFSRDYHKNNGQKMTAKSIVEAFEKYNIKVEVYSEGNCETSCIILKTEYKNMGIVKSCFELICPVTLIRKYEEKQMTDPKQTNGKFKRSVLIPVYVLLFVIDWCAWKLARMFDLVHGWCENTVAKMEKLK